jgi:ornithine cyclodeaminase/alanine dehydrogenase-like protein (mu-crystallin family)
MDIDEMLDALEQAFIDLSAGRANVPPRIAARTERGLLAAMPGYLSGSALEIKMVSVIPDNHESGIPSHRGMIALFDEDDGAPLAIMDAIHITAMRTAGGAAVSVRALSRPNSSTLTILGAGAQGHSHLAVVPRVRDFSEIRIASRTRSHAESLASLDSRATIVGSFEEAVSGADVVCLCTDVHGPVIRFEWLALGTHVTSVGGKFGPELDEETVANGTLFVDLMGAATSEPPAGAWDLQSVSPERLTELGQLLAGEAPGRRSDDEITVYKSTGHAVQDAAAARLVNERALELGVGTRVTI